MFYTKSFFCKVNRRGMPYPIVNPLWFIHYTSKISAPSLNWYSGYEIPVFPSLDNIYCTSALRLLVSPFQQVLGCVFRAPCRALKPPKIDSPCNFVQILLFWWFCFFASLLKSCLSWVRTSDAGSRYCCGQLGRGFQPSSTPQYPLPTNIHKKNKKEQGQIHGQ